MVLFDSATPLVCCYVSKKELPLHYLNSIFVKTLLRILMIVIAALGMANSVSAQTYVKLNGAYALVGVVNPQVEFKISSHSTCQAEVVYSPWQSINGHPMKFGILQNEYRYYFKEHNHGIYIGANVAFKVFNMSKPMLHDWRIVFQDRYCKGSGIMAGVVVGYEYRFAERWLVDVFVGFGYSYCWYNGYSMSHEIDMYPVRPEWKQPPYPDPYNTSAQWIPTKAGVSIGFLINRPK